MNSKIYRCGWCGCPTDSKGAVLQVAAMKRVIGIIETYNADSHTHLLNGDCCPDGDGNQNRMVRVTREMAMDAGDLSLEGEWVRW